MQEVAATERYRIVLLMDVTPLVGTSLNALDALPSHLAPLVVPYTKGQIEKVSSVWLCCGMLLETSMLTTRVHNHARLLIRDL